ncbi:hypothetical protein RxyAA322_11170 [Rubrobacter xylanophilus]|uniref:Uncharacterized protein n=1 Tax=Rubrobacter xylanophilus TaxID=49319 RepID=A0A510HKZ4_9ACTN|nr:hypothetical protein RxyAA322_11170 [Rubrobacter xylanophilus]
MSERAPDGSGLPNGHGIREMSRLPGRSGSTAFQRLRHRSDAVRVLLDRALTHAVALLRWHAALQLLQFLGRETLELSGAGDLPYFGNSAYL